MFRKCAQLTDTTQPLVESLEQRRLLSASLHGGLLAIKGTAAGNDIQIEVNHSNIVVTMDGSSKTFRLADVRRIKAMGGKGNDDIHFNRAGGKLSVPMTLVGGVGNDTLVGGNGDDVLKGGAGDDDCQGGTGDDTCVGGAGDDSVDGGAGDDSLDGNNGDDEIDGGAGNDDCDGGNGRDSVKGGKGSDHFHSDDAETEIEDKQGNDDMNDDHGGSGSGSDDMLG